MSAVGDIFNTKTIFSFEGNSLNTQDGKITSITTELGLSFHFQTQQFIRFLTAKTVTKWHRFDVIPVANLSNMYEFLRTLSNFSEYYERNAGEEPLSGLRSFRFHWEMLIQKAAIDQFDPVRRVENEKNQDEEGKHKHEVRGFMKIV